MPQSPAPTSAIPMALQEVSFDYLFIGMGAGNSLLLIQLHERGLLQDKHICILDPDPKYSNDRTFCFWATEEEVGRYFLGPLISKSWNYCKAGNASVQQIAPFSYYHVSGLDLYRYTRSILDAYTYQWFADAFTGAEQNPIQIGNHTIHAGVVFDSRLPEYSKPARHESSLKQSFLGWNITCNEDVFDPESFVMMDFSIEQHGATQFMYVLPFDRRNALVECTRFGVAPIVESDAEVQLNAYIRNQYGSFCINAEERGSIPMCSAPINAVHVSADWIPTGSRAGNLKPSTGYSFMSSCRHAEAIAKKEQGESKSSRFSFYDRLLLKILEERPQQGKRIFEQLFSSVPMPRVLRFLSEDVLLREEFGILSRLPKRLFISAALRDMLVRLNLLNTIPWLLTGVLLLLQWLGFENIGLYLLLAGLLIVGLPHGAIDHLLEAGKLNTPIKPLFILRYLGVSALMGFIWFISPLAGLWLFLGYSAWHFGETEFRQQGRNPGILSVLWGAAMLGMILCAHIPELNKVLDEMGISPVDPSWQFLAWVFAAVYVITGWRKGLMGLYLIPALALPLLHAFGLYFIADHSVKSSAHLLRGFDAPPGKLFIKALPFTLGALLLCLFFFQSEIWNTAGATGLFFIFLSCLSFPHVLAMNGFYRRNS
jgi:lycopene beta-cyclase